MTDDHAGAPAPEPIAAKTLASSILALLQADPGRYVSFGPYWPLVKALMKRYFTRENLALLGDHIDREAAAHMPPHADLNEALAAAIEFYRDHQAYGMGQSVFIDPATGDAWQLQDPDWA